MKHTSIAIKQNWRFDLGDYDKQVPAYLVTIAVPVGEVQERIDKEGAEETALELGRLILDAIRPLESDKGIGNG